MVRSFDALIHQMLLILHSLVESDCELRGAHRVALAALAGSLAACRYEDAGLLELVVGRRVLVDEAQFLQVVEQLLLVFSGHLLQL